MKLVKKPVYAALIAMSISGGHNAFAVDIVSDPGHTASTAAGWAAQAASWGSQLAQMANQLSQLQQTYNSLNGARGMGNLVNNPALRQYLPENYQSILNGGYGNSADIRQAAKLFGIEDTTLDVNGSTALSFESNANQAAINRAMAEDAYTRASQRFADIQVLLDKVNDTNDAKDVEDLQARIQAEQVMLQNESIKLAMVQQLAEAQKGLANQQSVEIGMASSKAPGGIPRF
ncbi:conserved exported hypothetical protein [Candidatus Methylobacter favarea]|jgi:type IV secretion system protein VirB5|uniref:P-type DNA transfer protein VirB5 n=1 Tax=Candidatus Methylobacter favarea TaxID=2707345 RepID=A0A8S0Y9W8_9GAMM|nr:P-type DNA transfer protein VirB5 [Candidatus Methylobacter favarea]CAA9890771.1 conserved exported hypothetical protein [Candidatus Methylobacter favarea]